MNVFRMNKNPKFYGENAHEFYPERFLPENCADWHPYLYIPFSAGTLTFFAIICFVFIDAH